MILATQGPPCGIVDNFDRQDRAGLAWLSTANGRRCRDKARRSANFCVSCRLTHTVQPPATDVELRLSELQTQIDRLSHALTQVRDVQDPAQPAEALAQLTERCAAILDQWTMTDERHQQAVVELEARLNNWNALEGRLQQESRHRLQELELTIEHEWQALRQTHEEPVKQLRDQAATLGETCVAAANLALRGFERAEARLAALEADLQGRMTQLSREVRLAVAELQDAPAARRPALNGEVSPFPLESVMRIHDELRASNDNGHDRVSLEGSVAQPRQEPLAIDASAATVERVTASSRAERREAAEARVRAESDVAGDARCRGHRRARRGRFRLPAGAGGVAPQRRDDPRDRSRAAGGARQRRRFPPVGRDADRCRTAGRRSA